MPRVVVNRIKPGDGDERHGTDNAYNNHKCRCVRCKEAHATAKYYLRLYHRMRTTLEDGDKRHGLNGYNNYACRCHTCCKAQSDDLKKRRGTSATISS